MQELNRRGFLCNPACMCSKIKHNPAKLPENLFKVPVFLAPMAGITDVPFRNLVSRLGAGLVVSEMVASAEYLTARPSALMRSDLGLDHARTAIQIAGRKPELMGDCAKVCVENGARHIDINMGCPAKKVVGGGAAGSALMREPELAQRIFAAVRAAVDVPVSVKMRLGWDDDSLNAPQIAQLAEAEGLSMVSVHGRTRCQFYKGHAHWQAVKAVRDAVSLPLVVNGDITDAATSRRALEQSGASAVMIGRGAQGRPWVLSQISDEISGVTPRKYSLLELSDIMCEHYEAMLSFYGTPLGVKVARKHLGWYVTDLDGGAGLVRQLQTSTEPKFILARLARLSEETSLRSAA